jgi:hypothetical protein
MSIQGRRPPDIESRRTAEACSAPVAQAYGRLPLCLLIQQHRALVRPTNAQVSHRAFECGAVRSRAVACGRVRWCVVMHGSYIHDFSWFHITDPLSLFALAPRVRRVRARQHALLGPPSVQPATHYAVLYWVAKNSAGWASAGDRAAGRRLQ